MEKSKRRKKRSAQEIQEWKRVNTDIRKWCSQYRQTRAEVHLWSLFRLVKNRAFGIIYRRVYGSNKDPGNVELVFNDLRIELEKNARLGTPEGKSRYPLEDPKVDQMNYIYGVMNNTIADKNQEIEKENERREIIEHDIPLGLERDPESQQQQQVLLDSGNEGSKKGEALKAVVGGPLQNGLGDRQMPVHDSLKPSGNSGQDSDGSNISEGTGPQAPPPETHSLIKTALGNKIYMTPEDLLAEEQANQLIRKTYEKALSKIIKAKDPRIKQILRFRDFEERRFKEIGRLLFPEWPVMKAEGFVKNKYYNYQPKIEQSMRKHRELRKLFKAMR